MRFFLGMPPRSQQLGINATDLHQLITSLKTCRFGPATALRTIHQQTCGRRLGRMKPFGVGNDHLFGSPEKGPQLQQKLQKAQQVTGLTSVYLTHTYATIGVC